MAKISTLTAMSLVLWLAMSVGSCARESWAERSQKGLREKKEQGGVQKRELPEPELDPKQIQELKDLVKECFTAIRDKQNEKAVAALDKLETALGDNQELRKDPDTSDVVEAVHEAEKMAMKGQFEQAEKEVHAAISRIRVLSEGEEKEQGGGGEGVQKSNSLEPELDPKELQELVNLLKKSFTAIRNKKKKKAQAALQKLVIAIRNNQELQKDQHTAGFVEAVHEAEKLVMNDQIEQAGDKLHASMSKIAALERTIVSEGEAEAKKEEDKASEPQRRQAIQTVMQQILEAIKGGHKQKSADLLADAYQLFQSDVTLNKEETAKMIPVIKETQKLVEQGAMDKAQQVFQGATNEMGKAQIINRKTGSQGPEPSFHS